MWVRWVVSCVYDQQLQIRSPEVSPLGGLFSCLRRGVQRSVRVGSACLRELLLPAISSYCQLTPLLRLMSLEGALLPVNSPYRPFVAVHCQLLPLKDPLLPVEIRVRLKGLYVSLLPVNALPVNASYLSKTGTDYRSSSLVGKGKQQTAIGPLLPAISP